ncbi:MAG: hypothetical protein IJ661_10265 [Lachnospiraceae bacterium]|nr:hypothetical protein [Lachnospiraceae bacterium]
MRITNKHIYNGYKTISLLSDKISFVPILAIHLITIAILVANSFARAYVISGIIVTFMIAPLYIYCGIRVKRYNSFLRNSILVKGIILNKIQMSGTEYLGGGKVEIIFEYMDNDGRMHKKSQKVQMFRWEMPYNKQFYRWEKLYCEDEFINVLVNTNNYNIAYVPMRENYCIKYKKVYSLDLNFFNN